MFGKIALGIAALSAATLLLESALIRFLSVTQFYHFAFFVVGLALLGFGASGALLSLPTRLREMTLERLLPLLGMGFSISVLAAYGIVNLLPFDSYSIAWEGRQILYFGVYYFALGLPFLFSGLGIGAGLASKRQASHLIYASNLAGSGLGALLAVAFLWSSGVIGALLACICLGMIPALLLWRRTLPGAVLLIGIGGIVSVGIFNLRAQIPLGMRISEYKGLAHALRYPGSEAIFGSWNAISRVDVIANAGTRQLPGLSYTYPGSPPPQLGLSVDGESVQPITLTDPVDFEAAPYLPEALAFGLRPDAQVLILEPGGGLAVLQALAGGARDATAVVGDPLLRSAVARTAPQENVYADPRVTTITESSRVFLQQNKRPFDIVWLPLTDTYRPVTSGAFSLTESYDLTIEAFRAMLENLQPDGLLVVTRWLQFPPSECLRLTITVASALEQSAEIRPAEALVVYRGVQTVTVIAQPDGFSAAELQSVRAFVNERKYDLVWAPDIRVQEVNRYNRLPEPAVYNAIRDFLDATDRQSFFASYQFAVDPPNDDRPFFFHFFTWEQTPQVLESFGKTWQPFGGSGYFVLLAMLLLAAAFSTGLLAAPSLIGRVSGAQWRTLRPKAATTAYFSAIGIAFLFVEIPLIQRWILLVSHPTYAFAGVVFILLLFSGFGSAWSRRVRLPEWALLAVLVLLALSTPWVQSLLIQRTLGWSLTGRLAAAALSLAPLGVLMGLPFPMGLAWLERSAPEQVPWAWAINGCASVMAAVLAAILSLSYGFSLVLMLGGVAYAAAGVILALHR